MMTQSLYESIGGESAVNAAVDIFYRKALADTRISRFFAGVEMDQLIIKQRAFLTMVLGGPNKYVGKDVRTGHAHLLKRGLDDTHVNAVVENLTEALNELHVKDEDIAKIASIIVAIGHSVRDVKPEQGMRAEAGT